MNQTNFINFTIGTKTVCWKLTSRKIYFFLTSILFLMGFAYILGTQVLQQKQITISDDFLPEINTTLEQQNIAIKRAREDAESNIDILGARLGNLQHQVIRLNALGQRLTQKYNIDEIDFSNDNIAIGGTYNQEQSSLAVNDFVAELSNLERIIQQNTEQLAALNTLLTTKSNADNRHPSIMPIKAYVSSWFGWRSDPMRKHSRKSFHEGIDFSADIGTSIKSVADGIVSWSGPKDQYGNFIEIDHGNGYVTRYGHIHELFVKVGQRVSKGQQIASVGMTGRSTGPHLHFEVQKDGKHLDPKNFMTFN